MKSSKVLRTFKNLLTLIKLLKEPGFIREFKRWFNSYRPGSILSFSFSQSFEDLFLLRVLPSTGTYLDVGAHHPLRFSNSHIFYTLGWRGVNIDANPHLLDAFYNGRPEDVNICAAIGTKNSYQLTIFDEPLLSSVDAEFIELAGAAGFKKRMEVEITGLSLRFVLETYFESGCDLLLLDIEGAELDALTSGDFKNISPKLLPKHILLEEDRSIEKILISQENNYLISSGYELRYIMPTATFYTLVL